MINPLKRLKKKEYWQGKELTWTTEAEIRNALSDRSLPAETPLIGVLSSRIKEYRGSGWKVLLVSPDQHGFIVYRPVKKRRIN